MSDAPTEPGGFVGDIYYGDPDHTTLGTHRWNGSEWMALASEAEALTMLLVSARARIANLERFLDEARDACNQTRLAFAGYVSVESALRKLDALYSLKEQQP